MPIKKDLRKTTCVNCGAEMKLKAPASTNNLLWGHYDGNIPMCTECIKQLYEYYFRFYEDDNCRYAQYKNERPEKLAIRKICSIFNIYYSDTVFDSAETSWYKKKMAGSQSATLIVQYLFVSRSRANKNKTFDDTLEEESARKMGDDSLTTIGKKVIVDGDNKVVGSVADRVTGVDEKTRKFFGEGFSKGEYQFLQHQYDDWTSRHECQTKAQEEIFKRIAFNQLEHYKAEKDGRDTKEIDKTFQSLLNSGNLQPKQTKASTLSSGKSLGELIDVWEENRPVPEVDEALKDVDGIGLMIDVFYKGHTAKNLDVEKATSHLYDDYMKQYTVDKPEYETAESSEALFDSIFGKQLENE